MAPPDNNDIDITEFGQLSLTLNTQLSPSEALNVPKPTISQQKADLKDKYPAKEHAKKVARHLAGELSAAYGLIYLAGMTELETEDSDEPVPFKQRRFFYYLSGVDEPNCAVAYSIENDQLILFIPEQREGHDVLYIGQTPTIEECRRRYDVDVIEYNRNRDCYLGRYARMHPNSTLYVLHDKPEHKPPEIPKGMMVNSRSLFPAMCEARVTKTAYEIELLRKANNISSFAHRKVLEHLHNATNETHIEACFTKECIWQGAKKQAYGIIAASGPNAATLHYGANNEDLDGRETVCLDAGCEYKNYASDITRTFPISGTWSAEGKRIYDLVASMQEQCIEMVKPGIPYKDLQDRAMRVGVEGLLELGVLKDGTADEIIEAGTGRAFFPHGLGHHIGLECHDVDGQVRLLQVGIKSKHQLRSPKRFTFGMFTSFTRYTDITLSQDTRALESGMVITIEPGIYFLRYAMDLYKKMPEHNKYIDFDAVETYYKVGGVRIEDDLLVTDDGYENLTTAPKGEEALELIKKYSSAAK